MTAASCSGVSGDERFCPVSVNAAVLLDIGAGAGAGT